MPKYAVTIIRTEIYNAIVEIEAKDEDEAQDKAQKIIDTPEEEKKLNWDCQEETYDIEEVALDDL